MKTKLLLITFIMAGFVGFSQMTHVPDANFRRSLSESYGLTIVGESILNSEAISVTMLDNIFQEDISDLTGIEAFVNITILDCNENNLSALDLSANTALTLLYVNDNSLTSLNLPANNVLTLLDCSNNSLISLNIKSSGLDRRQQTFLYADGNTSLTCIETNSDSFEFRKTNGEWRVNDGVTFSTSCSSGGK